MKRRILVCVSLALLLIGGGHIVGCNQKPSQPNIVLLVIDTLRADVLPFYGGREDTAPFLSKLGKEGVVFTNAISTSSWTAPATASILTGLYPLEHGILMGRKATKKLFMRDPSARLNKIPEDVVTVAELMKNNGYATFAAVDNGNIRMDSGFGQGFEHFDSYQNLGAENINRVIKSWRDKLTAAKQYFLYIQYMDPHHPYIEHPEWFDGKNKRGIPRALSAYQSEVSYVDSKVKEIYELLGWDRNTVILVTSDHGEEFGEHGSSGHGKTLFSEVVRVPFIVYYPQGRFKQGTISEYVSGVDTAPTLYELAGITPSHHMSGQSLVRHLRGESVANTRKVSHLWKKQKAGSIVEMSSIYGRDRTLILSSKSKRPMLFNTDLDKGERRNIYKAEPDIVLELTDALSKIKAAFKIYNREWIPVPIDEEDFEE